MSDRTRPWRLSRIGVSSLAVFSFVALGGLAFAQDPKPPKDDEKPADEPADDGGEKKPGDEKKPAEKPDPKDPKAPKDPKDPEAPKPPGKITLDGVSHFPLKVGARWQYNLTFQLKQLGEVGKVLKSNETKHRLDTFVARPQTIQEQKLAVVEWRLDGKPTPEQREFYLVQDGYVQCVRRLLSSGPQVKAWSFTPRLKMVPAEPKAGLTWTWKGTNAIDKGTQVFKVERFETVEVPAGTFKRCAVLTVKYTGEDESTGTRTRWLAPKVGVIKESNVVKNTRQEMRFEGVLVRYDIP